MPKADQRQTVQKTFLENILIDSSGPLSHSEIMHKAHKAGVAMGRVTVFRYLKKQLEAKKIRKIQSPRGEVLYEWIESTQRHQHHFFCNNCKTAFPVEGCGLKVSGFKVPRGFVVQDHEVQLIGLCDQCKAA